MSIYDILLKIKDENLNHESIYAKIIELMPEIPMGSSCYDQEQLFIYVHKHEEDYECGSYIDDEDYMICNCKNCRYGEVYNCLHIIITNYEFIVSMCVDDGTDKENDNTRIIRYYNKKFGKLTADIAKNIHMNSHIKYYGGEITLGMMLPKMTKSARK